MRRHLDLPQQFEQVALKVLWRFVVVLHDVGLRMFLQAALKQVERRVVTSIQDILDVLAEGHFEFSPRVALTNLELGVSEPLDQPIHSPVSKTVPVVCHALDDHWPASKLEAPEKLRLREFIVIDTLNVVRKSVRSIYMNSLSHLSRFDCSLERLVEDLALTKIVTVLLPLG